MVSHSNPTLDVTINDLELGLLAMQLLVFSPGIVPLDHIHMCINNTATQGWDNRSSFSTSSSVFVHNP